MLAVSHQMSYKSGIKGVEAPSIPNQNEGLVRMAPLKIKQLPKNIKIPKGARAIPLTQGAYAIVDAEDYDYLMQWNWTLRAPKGLKERYALAHDAPPTRASIGMHRLIMNCPKNMIVDHINNNGLDNRKGNLRITIRAKNSFNRRPNKNSFTKGVTLHKGKWCARIGLKRKRLWLGYFNSKEAAQAAYNIASAKYFGEHACPVHLNSENKHQKEAIEQRNHIHTIVECANCDESFKKKMAHHKFCSLTCKRMASKFRRITKLRHLKIKEI